MKKLLGLVASPRKLGNCELLVKQIHRQLPKGWELQLLRLTDFDIRPCKGCFQCLFGTMKCVQKDDFEVILESLVHSDAYVVVSPTYLLGANAVLKRFLDRGLSFYRHIDELWGKPAVGAVVAGFPGMEGYSKIVVDSFIKLTMAEHRRSEVLCAALPGEILMHEEGKKAARQLAEALITDVRPTTGDSATPRCPLCGGDTFRFLGDGKVRCMLCSSGGTYDCQAEHLRIETAAGEHPLFLTHEAAKNHLVYLQSLKERFLADRKQLKELVKDYSEDGSWISPPVKM